MEKNEIEEIEIKNTSAPVLHYIVFIVPGFITCQMMFSWWAPGRQAEGFSNSNALRKGEQLTFFENKIL